MPAICLTQVLSMCKLYELNKIICAWYWVANQLTKKIELTTTYI
jgi:hypothetical protein